MEFIQYLIKKYLKIMTKNFKNDNQKKKILFILQEQGIYSKLEYLVKKELKKKLIKIQNEQFKIS